MSDEIPFNPEGTFEGFTTVEITGNKYDIDKIRDASKEAATMFVDGVGGYEGAGRNAKLEGFVKKIEGVFDGDYLSTEIRSFDKGIEMRFEQTAKKGSSDILQFDEDGNLYLYERDGPQSIHFLDNTYKLTVSARSTISEQERLDLENLRDKLLDKYNFIKEKEFTPKEKGFFAGLIVNGISEKYGAPRIPLYELNFDDSLIDVGKISFPATKLGSENEFGSD